MIEFLTDWLVAIWVILVESGPYLLVGFFLAGLIKSLIPEEKVFRHMGKGLDQGTGAMDSVSPCRHQDMHRRLGSLGHHRPGRRLYLTTLSSPEEDRALLAGARLDLG